MFKDHWATSYRNGRVIAALILVSGALVFLLWNVPNKPISITNETARVVEVSEGEEGFGTLLLELADGGRARILLPDPQPAPGDTIPIRVETYADGERRVALDLIHWLPY